jgi:hypothetical protein
MNSNGSVDALVDRLVDCELQLMTVDQLRRLKMTIDEILVQDGLELAVKTLNAAKGPPCAVCGGPIWPKRTGRRPVVCGPKCVKERARRRRQGVRR